MVVTHVPIERASSADLLAVASDLPGSPAVVAAIIVLESGAFDLAAAQAALADRIRTVPRLRQRLVRAPFGCGRSTWVDDDQFDIQNHVDSVACRAPGDEAALLAVAAECVMRRLPANRPLWSARLVWGLAGGRSALVLVLHHVLADGIGGLAILARLVDGAPPAPIRDYPRPAPSRRGLALDALRVRLMATTHVVAGARRLGSAARELAPHGVPRSPRSTLNQPTGTTRQLAVARADLASVQRLAHLHAATVNDVVLMAVTGALHTVLRQRDEDVDHVVISIPISGRRTASATDLGNEVGAIPLQLACIGDPMSRLAAIGAATHAAKTTAPGSSSAVLAPAFRALAAVGLLRWLLDRQRLITTFVTNVRGPTAQLRFLGMSITDLIPVSPITGNVTVAFAASSYAGSLTVTVIADPARCPDLSLLAVALQSEFDLDQGGTAVGVHAG